SRHRDAAARAGAGVGVMYRARPRRRFSRTVRRRLIATMVALPLSSALVMLGCGPGGNRSVEVAESDAAGYDWSSSQSHRPDPRTLSVGVTHSQYSIDEWSHPDAAASARAVLTATASYQNQHIYGWGAGNPEPSPGQFDWSSLDRRMDLIR